MNKTLVASAILIVAAPASVLAGTKQNDTLMVLGGSDTALAGFEEAAGVCKFKDVSKIPAENGKGSWVRVAGYPSDISSKPFNCVTGYVMSHTCGPNALSIIGNAAL